jgi:hypothetical protein
VSDRLDVPNKVNVELSEEEVLTLVERMGFRLEKRGERKACGYIQDPNSMLQNLYQVLSFWPPKGEIKLEEHSLVAGTCVSDLQGSAFRPAQTQNKEGA